MENFADLGVSPVFIGRLRGRDISAPTAIQRLVIPPLLAGKSVIFRSETGTGKTFAYLIPALQRLLAGIGEAPAGSAPDDTATGRPRYQGPELLICAPTFELCSQIKGEIDFLLARGKDGLPGSLWGFSPNDKENAQFCAFSTLQTPKGAQNSGIFAVKGRKNPQVPQAPGNAAGNINTALLIGSAALARQIDALKKKPLAVVGNPGRLLLLSKMGKLKFPNLRFLVLDEADRMTAEESLEETRELIRLIVRDVRNGSPGAAACSATISGKTGELLPPLFAGAELIESGEQEILRERIEHWAIFSEGRRKVQTLRSLLAAVKTRKAGFKALVFAGRNDDAGKIVSQLQFHHIPAAGLFGRMDKRERKNAVDAFRAGKISALVSSDLAARGLDIPGISHVVAMDVPADRETYIHRSGRTGRAGKRGVMVSIGDEAEMRRLALLEKKLGITVRPRELYQGKVREPAPL
ncbi:MAG: DEAD/DEAH box helicase [Treponema sp.]|jgi:superfamily II DNA/RNA helicase|nr:DEAD/DEAH box helicase [Treponema sp.]